MFLGLQICLRSASWNHNQFCLPFTVQVNLRNAKANISDGQNLMEYPVNAHFIIFQSDAYQIVVISKPGIIKISRSDYIQFEGAGIAIFVFHQSLQIQNTCEYPRNSERISANKTSNKGSVLKFKINKFLYLN